MLSGRRIVFVLGNLELGGAERQALLLARYLVEQERAEVEVWGLTKTGPVAEIGQKLGMPSRVIPYPLHGISLEANVDACQLLRDAKPDILLPYTLRPNVVCGLIWQNTGARLCVWNQRDAGLQPVSPVLEGIAARVTPLLISNSVAGARFLTDRLGVDRSQVTVIPNGVALAAPEFDRRAWRERLAVDDRCFVACMLANLHANKDHATLLHAWRNVSRKLEANGREALLVLAGRHDGAYESLASLATELKIEDSVRFIGSVTDVSGLLGAVDVGVLSSRSESCPNAVLESMAAGLPVAGTDIEGIREVVGPAGVKFLAAPGDADALATVLLTLANEPQLRAEAGAANRERVRNNYDPERMCKETTALLAQIQ